MHRYVEVPLAIKKNVEVPLPIEKNVVCLWFLKFSFSVNSAILDYNTGQPKELELILIIGYLYLHFLNEKMFDHIPDLLNRQFSVQSILANLCCGCF